MKKRMKQLLTLVLSATMVLGNIVPADVMKDGVLAAGLEEEKKQTEKPSMQLYKNEDGRVGVEITNNSTSDVSIELVLIPDDAENGGMQYLDGFSIIPEASTVQWFEYYTSDFSRLEAGTYKLYACADDYENEASDYVALDDYSIVVEETVTEKTSVGVGDVTGRYYFTDYLADECIGASAEVTYTTMYDGREQEDIWETDIYDVYDNRYYLNTERLDKEYLSWEITSFFVVQGVFNESEFKLTKISSDNFEMGTLEEPKVAAPSLELYMEDECVKGVKLTNNIESGRGYIYLVFSKEDGEYETSAFNVYANKSVEIPFERFASYSLEAGEYQLKAYTMDRNVDFESEKTTLDYKFIVKNTTYTGDPITVVQEYDEQENKTTMYVPKNEIPEGASVQHLNYADSDGDIWGESSSMTEDGSQWYFTSWQKNVRIESFKYSFINADESGMVLDLVEVGEESIESVTRELSSKYLVILDYDEYQSFVASGGTVTVDSANGTFSVTDGQRPSDWGKPWPKEISLFGTSVYQLVGNLLESVSTYNKYGVYDIEGNDISEEHVSKYDIVLEKYEPEIVWVQSMKLNAPEKLEKNATGVVTAELDAGQDKYPFRETPQVRYESSNEDVLAVDPETGALTAGNMDGVAIITAYADEDLKAQEGLTNIVTATISITVGDGEKVAEVFNDVRETNWHMPYVQYVYDRGLMAGSNGSFNPTNNVTRAQVITTLYRLIGAPKVTDYSACKELKDVKEGKWYTDAVCWAYNTGITTGNPTTKLFNLNVPVTREQLSTFIYRYADNEKLDILNLGDISSMLNADQVGKYAKTAVEWAVGAGLISGSKKTYPNGAVAYDLAPQSTATRAQMAAILQRFCEQYDL